MVDNINEPKTRIHRDGIIHRFCITRIRRDIEKGYSGEALRKEIEVLRAQGGDDGGVCDLADGSFLAGSKVVCDSGDDSFWGRRTRSVGCIGPYEASFVVELALKRLDWDRGTYAILNAAGQLIPFDSIREDKHTSLSLFKKTWAVARKAP